jgi:hypothetical protein
LLILGLFLPPSFVFSLLVVWVLVPLIFSLKRILRARYRSINLFQYLCVYFVDVIYVISREYGISSALLKRLTGISLVASRLDK